MIDDFKTTVGVSNTSLIHILSKKMAATKSKH